MFGIQFGWEDTTASAAMEVGRMAVGLCSMRYWRCQAFGYIWTDVSV